MCENIVDLEKMVQNDNILANIGLDTAENEPSEVSQTLKIGVVGGSSMAVSLSGRGCFDLGARLFRSRGEAVSLC